MSNKLFLPKEDQRLPDNYGCKLTLITGKVVELELASHSFSEAILSVKTKEDEILWYFPANILSIEFDKRFSKMMAIREEKILAAEKAKKANA